MRSRCWGRRTRTHRSGRGIEGGPCEDYSASPPGADPVLQDHSRTCQGTSCSSRRWRAAQTHIHSQRASMDVVGGSAICEGDPTHANRPPRVARLDQRTQLRSQERTGVFGQCQDGVSHQSGHSTARGSFAGRAHGRVDQITVDGIADRRVRCEKKGVVVAYHGGEPSVRTCYGLRGVRGGKRRTQAIQSTGREDVTMF